MTGGASGQVERAPQARTARSRRTPSVARLTLIVVAAIAVLTTVVFIVFHRFGRARREQEALLTATLDKLVTAQEGFYYDSARYVSSLRSLRAFTVPPDVRLEIGTATSRSWWGMATHARLPRRHCVVWVGAPPTSLPDAARVPENETKPLCFDDVQNAR